jgi:hypothetical protein
MHGQSLCQQVLLVHVRLERHAFAVLHQEYYEPDIQQMRLIGQYIRLLISCGQCYQLRFGHE